jgi:DNA-binding transcriptional regulator PaaX
MPGLYAAGEAAGFGGGGMHGYRALEGTFLGGCLFSGPITGETGTDLAGRLWDLPTLAADARELIELSSAALSWLRRDDPSAMAEAFLVSIAVVRFLRAEPLLPPELTARQTRSGWPPDELRRAYDVLEQAYAAQMSSFLVSASQDRPPGDR